MNTSHIDFAIIVILFVVCGTLSWLLNPIVAIFALLVSVGVWELCSDYFYLRVKQLFTK